MTPLFQCFNTVAVLRFVEFVCVFLLFALFAHMFNLVLECLKLVLTMKLTLLNSLDLALQFHFPSFF